jgi:hypothetical protein
MESILKDLRGFSPVYLKDGTTNKIVLPFLQFNETFQRLISVAACDLPDPVFASSFRIPDLCTSLIPDYL